MRAAVIGLLVGLGVLLALGSGFPEANAQRGASDRATPSADIIALSFDAGDGRQQVTVIDPRGRVMAVYHVDRATGALSLKSVRNVHWDLQIEDFNSANPTPREIRALTDPRTGN
jgi:hypothetical protein